MVSNSVPAAPGVAFAKIRLKLHLGRCSDVPTAQKKSYAYYASFLVAAPGAEAARKKSSEKYPSAREVVWNEDIYMDCTESSSLRMRLYEVHRITNKLVCETTVSISDVLGKGERSVPLSNAQTGATCTLHLTASHEQDGGRSEVEEVMASMTDQPLQTTVGAVVAQLDPVAAVVATVASKAGDWQPLLDKIGAFMKATEALAEIHPYTKVAFSVISAGYKLAQAQKERDESVSKLVDALRSAYDLVVDAADLENMSSKQIETVAALNKHIINCGHFIIEYAKRGFWGRAVSGAVSSTDENIAEFRARFEDLRAMLTTQGVLAVQRDMQVILGTMNYIADSVGLLGMNYSKNARWRSGKKCLPGTQTRLLSRIEDWVHDTSDDAPRMLLVTGVAGVGKSAVSNTIASRLQELSRLGASYCFDRNDTANLRPDLLFPTIARHLADRYPSFKQELCRENDAASFGTTDLEDQFENLIKKPLSKLADKIVGPVTVVIDALDESANLRGRHPLLTVLANRFGELPSKVRLLCTSRPEMDVQQIFGNKAGVRHISMSPSDNALEDIRAFVDSALVNLNKQSLDVFSANDRDMLARKAEGLFQWAFVACTMIVVGDNPDFPPTHEEMRSTLTRLLSLSGGELDPLYYELLSRLFPETYPNHALLLRLLGLIAESREPLAAASLMELLQLAPSERHTVFHMLGGLGALLTGVSDEDTPIRTLHTSFRDFLTDVTRSERFCITPGAVHLDAAYGCLRVLNTNLKFNMCKLESSYVANKHVADLQQRISDNVPGSLAYAAHFWSHHIQFASPQWSSDIEREVSELLCDKFLFWLELLSVLDAVFTAPPALSAVRARIISKNLQLVSDDCCRFIRVFGRPISHSAPHVYLSALALAPRSSLVHQQPYSKLMGCLATMSNPLDTWPQAEVSMNANSHVRIVAFSPDGRWVAFASEDGTTRVWDAETGVLVRAVQGNIQKHFSIPLDVERILALVFLPDRIQIITNSKEGTLQTLKIETGVKTDRDLEGFPQYSMCAAFSSDGHHVAVGTYRYTVEVWNVDTGLRVHTPFKGHSGSVSSIAFSPDGRLIVSGSEDHTLRIWDVETGAQACEPLAGHTSSVIAVAVSPDNLLVVSGSHDETSRLWDARTGRQLRTLAIGDWTSLGAAVFSPDGRRIVFSFIDGDIQVWDAPASVQLPLPSEQIHPEQLHPEQIHPEQLHPEQQPTPEQGWQLRTTLKGHTSSVDCVAFSPDGLRIVSGSWDGTARIWNLGSDAQAQSLTEQPNTAIGSSLFLFNNRHVLFSLRDGTTHLWDAETGVRVHSPLSECIDGFSKLALSPDGFWIATGAEDGRVRIWDVETGTQAHSPDEGHKEYITSLAFSPDGQWIASGANDGTVAIWSSKTCKLVYLSSDDIDWVGVGCVAFSTDSRSAISLTASSVKTWDVQTGTLLSTLSTGIEVNLYYETLSPNGLWYLASGAVFSIMKLRDTKTAEIVRELSAPRDGCAAFSPDSCLLVADSSDHTLNLWDTETGAQAHLPLLVDHTNRVHSLTFSPNSRRLVSMSEHTVGIWDIEVDEQLTGERQISLKPPSHARVDPLLMLKHYPCTHIPAHLNSESASPLFRLTADGWIEDMSCSPPRLILWIPAEARERLSIPLVSHFAVPFPIRSLDLSNFAHGARWTECYDSSQSV